MLPPFDINEELLSVSGTGTDADFDKFNLFLWSEDPDLSASLINKEYFLLAICCY
jgi:hypothetical protein